MGRMKEIAMMIEDNMSDRYIAHWIKNNAVSELTLNESLDLLRSLKGD